MSMSLTYQQAATHCNSHMLSNAYFRCSIIKLHEKEEKELRHLCEITIL